MSAMSAGPEITVPGPICVSAVCPQLRKGQILSLNSWDNATLFDSIITKAQNTTLHEKLLLSELRLSRQVDCLRDDLPHPACRCSLVLLASCIIKYSRAGLSPAFTFSHTLSVRHFYIVKMRHRVFDIILLHLAKLLLPIFHLLSKRIFIIVRLNVIAILRIPVFIVKGRSILPVAGTFG